jgi:hypothetical protein
VRLLTPFKNVFGESVTELKFPAALTVADILWMRREGGTDPYLQAVKLVQRVTGIDMKDVEKLDVRDFDAAQRELEALQEVPKSPESSDSSKTS